MWFKFICMHLKPNQRLYQPQIFISLIPKLSVNIQINSQCYKSQADTNYLIVLCNAFILGASLTMPP